MGGARPFSIPGLVPQDTWSPVKNHHECPQETGDNKKEEYGCVCAQFTDEENRFKRGRAGHTFSPQISP